MSNERLNQTRKADFKGDHERETFETLAVFTVCSDKSLKHQ